MNIDDSALDRLSRLIVQEQEPLGLRLDGRYVVESRIARGGMGEVFLARDLTLERRVAIKILAKELCQESWARRFRDEARTMSHIDHPGVVPVHDLGSLPDGRLYYAMSYVEGETLAGLLKPGRDLRRVVRILMRVATIVQQAHDRGVLHLDLKPANIMIGSNDEVYVLDWGIARVKDEIRVAGGAGIEAGTGRTATGAVLGTLEYMPPEQARGERSAVGGRSDVYMLGAILFEVLTGAAPRGGADAADLLLRAQAEPVELPASKSADSPRDLEAVAMRALAFDPAGRYACPRDLAEELRRWLEGESVEARRSDLAYRLAKHVRRRRAVLLATAGGLLIAAAILVPRWREARRELGEVQQEAERAAALRVRARAALGQGNRVMEDLLHAMNDLQRTPEELAAAAERAEKHFREALELMPKEPEASLGLSRSFQIRYKFKEALQWIDRAVQDGPDYIAARLERLRIAAEQYEDLHHGRRREGEGEPAGAEELRRHLEEDLAYVKKAARDAQEPAYAESLMVFAQRDYERAQEMLGHWLAANPTDAQAHYWRAHALYHLNRYDQAIEEANQSIERRARDHNAWKLRSMCRRDQGDIQGALRDADQVVRLSPYWYAYSARASIHRNAEDLDSALKDLDRAVELEPQKPKLLTERANIRRLKSDLDGSARDLEEALRLDPDCVDALIGRARLHLARDRWDGVIADVDRVKKLDPGSIEPYTLLGWGYGQGMDLDLAIQNYTKAIEMDPRNAESYWLRGNVRISQRKYDLAIQDCDEAAAISPLDARVPASRGYARRKKGDLQGALVDIDLSLKLNPRVANTWAIRADIDHDLNDQVSYLADLSKSLELKPRQPWLLYRRALVHESTDRDLAIRDYSAAIQVDPKNLSALINRGLLRHSISDYEGAAADFRSVLKHAPLEWHNRGQAEKCLGHSEREIARLKAVSALPPKIRLPGTALKDSRDCPEQFGNLRAAASEAAAMGDAHRFYAALGSIAQRYEIDGLALQEALLGAVPSASPGVLDLESDLLLEAMMTGRSDLLGRASSAVLRLRRLSPAPKLPDWWSPFLSENETWDRIEGLRDPSPPPGDLSGRLLAFSQGDWSRGLPMLASHSQAPVKWAAERDLRGAATAAESLEIGDTWRELAMQEKSLLSASRLRSRAGRWYDWANGLSKEAPGAGRMEALPSPLLPPLDLLRRIVPSIHQVTGDWTCDGGMLINHTTPDEAWIDLPYEPPDEYDLVFEVERKLGPHCFVIGLATPKTQAIVIVDGWGKTTSGLGFVDRTSANENETSVKNRVWLKNDQPNELRCQVRRGWIRVLVNGETMVDWKGNFARLILHSSDTPRNRRALFLATWQNDKEMKTDFLIRRIELTPISGPGRFVR